MALQQFVFGFVVLIICTSKGSDASLVCGKIEGHDDSPQNWPWQVSITKDYSYICGGSLINDQWVMTSAQYLYQIPNTQLSSLVVHLGSTVSSSFSDSNVTREVVVKTCHPSYDYIFHSHTICLLKLSAPVSFGPNIQPVCLAARGSTFHSGDSGLVAGWNTQYNGYIHHTYNEGNMSVLGPNECYCRRYTRPSNNTLCVETTDYESVQTTAFPLMVKQDSVWVQAGIINNHCSKSYPCLSPKLSEYQDWITEETGGNNQTGFVYLSSPREYHDMDVTCSYSTYSSTYPTDSSTYPTDSSTYPTDPSTYPTDSSTYPTDSSTYPTDSSTYPTDPSTYPTDSSTYPTDPSTYPTDPSTCPICDIFASGDKIIPHFGQLLSLCSLTLLLFVMG